MAIQRMAWSGRCNDCGTVYILFPSDEQSKAEQEEISTTWPVEGECMTGDCYGIVEWNGNDPLRDVLAARLL